MNLYVISNEVQALMNSLEFDENGELLTDIEEQLNELQLSKSTEVLDIGRVIKNLNAESTAIKSEIDNLITRRKRLDKKTEWLRKYLTDNIAGENFQDATTEISWRKSTSVSILDESVIPKSVCRYTPESWCPDKIAIKDAICCGQEIPGAVLENKLNLQIK